MSSTIAPQLKLIPEKIPVGPSTVHGGWFNLCSSSSSFLVTFRSMPGRNTVLRSALVCTSWYHTLLVTAVKEKRLSRYRLYQFTKRVIVESLHPLGFFPCPLRIVRHISGTRLKIASLGLNTWSQSIADFVAARHWGGIIALAALLSHSSTTRD